MPKHADSYYVSPDVRRALAEKVPGRGDQTELVDRVNGSEYRFRPGRVTVQHLNDILHGRVQSTPYLFDLLYAAGLPLSLVLPELPEGIRDAFARMERVMRQLDADALADYAERVADYAELESLRHRDRGTTKH